MNSGQHTIRIKDEVYSISRDDVIEAARSEAPRRVNAYYVVVEGRQFPPKQLLRAATKTTQPFDSGVAVRALESLGFEVVRLEGAR
jgi:hypothetical protein